MPLGESLLVLRVVPMDAVVDRWSRQRAVRGSVLLSRGGPMDAVVAFAWR